MAQDPLRMAWFRFEQISPLLDTGLAASETRIESLFPRSRIRGENSSTIPEELVQYALALLEEEPKRTLFTVSFRLRDHFDLEKPPSRSSLYRALRKEPRYRKLRKRARGERKIRRRFQALHPHEIGEGGGKCILVMLCPRRCVNFLMNLLSFSWDASLIYNETRQLHFKEKTLLI